MQENIVDIKGICKTFFFFVFKTFYFVILTLVCLSQKNLFRIFFQTNWLVLKPFYMASVVQDFQSNFPNDHHTYDSTIEDLLPNL